MAVEPNTFKTVVNLKSHNIMDLVQTVGQAAVLNPHLTLAPANKMTIACAMLSFAHTMLESCGAKIDLTVQHETWTHAIQYQTGDSDSCGFSDLLE